MTDMQLMSCKKLLRSVLIPEQDGIPFHLIGTMYDIVMEPLPHKAFGCVSAAEFVMQKMPDVAHVTTNARGENVFMAVATEDTAHITRMVSLQKSRRKALRRREATKDGR